MSERIDSLSTPNTKIYAKVAESESEKRLAYQLRYQVFTAEQGDDRYANHETKQYKDSDDVEESVLFVAESNGEIVATSRLKLLARRNFIAAEQYHLDVLAERLNLSMNELSNQLGCMDRLVVCKEMRGLTVAALLASAGESLAAKLGVRCIVGTYKTEYQTIGALYTSLGYTKYAVGTYRDVSCECMYKLLDALSEKNNVRD